MFDYQDLESGEYEGLRLYTTPKGIFYPSVTTVFGRTASKEKLEALAKWREAVGEEKANSAAIHGTNVHLLIEMFLKKEPLPTENINTEDIGAFNSLKGKLKNITEIWCQEQALYSDLLEIAGRTDLIGCYKGVPSVVDFKTSSKIKTDADIEEYKMQLCAYAVMHNELYGTDIQQGVILMSSEKGFPQEFVVKNVFEYLDKLTNRINEFYERIL